MKAMIIKSYGPPETLTLSEVDDPEDLENGEVLVEIHASSVNPVDCKIRSGKMKWITGRKFPKILGCDFAGKVLESNNPKYSEGDEVFGLVDYNKGGCYEDKIVVTEKNLSLKPKNLDIFEAAVLPLVGLTALQALTKKSSIKDGDHILINGCSGGVGSAAVQIAKYYNAEVTGVCSTKNLEFSKSLGLDKVIDYTKEPVIDQNLYDIIFDTIGNLKFSQAKKSLKPNGTFVTTAASFGLVLLSLLHKVKIVNVKPSESELELLSDIASKGFIRPVIDTVYNFTDLPDAHKYSETGRVCGKLSIVLKE